MLLGKRPRAPIRRTTSMTGIPVDPPTNDVDATEGSDQNHQMTVRDLHVTAPEEEFPDYQNNTVMMDSNYGGSSYDPYDRRFLASMVSPRNDYRRNNSCNFMETAHFLRSCSFCCRRLAPGKDIYMYRGDTAFCSLECREQQMKQDERKEKYSVMASKKEDRHASPSTTSSKASSKSETVAAA